MKVNIYPSITTTVKDGWQKQIEEIKFFKLKKIGMFPTVLGKSDREELYRQVKKLEVEIPFVHLRDDMGVDEVEYLIANFKTKLFNVHLTGDHPSNIDYGKHQSKIYVENLQHIFNEKKIEKYAGFCFDVAHLEDKRLLGSEVYDFFMGILRKYGCGLWHINIIKKEMIYDPSDRPGGFYDYHLFSDLSEFDYVVRYKKWLPKVVVLELENSISQQLEAKKYLEKLFS